MNATTTTERRTEDYTTTNRDYNYTTSSTTTNLDSSSSSSVYVFPEKGNDRQHDPMLRRDLELIKQIYAAILDRPMPAPIEAGVLLDLIDGTPAADYLYALKETAFAPSPSWRYTMAIMRRLKNPDAHKQKPHRQVHQGKQVAEQQYTQREYTHSESAIDAMMEAWQQGKM